MGVNRAAVHLYHREPEHNIGSAAKDRAVLAAVGHGFEQKGLEVRYFDLLPGAVRETPALVLSMFRDRENCLRLEELYPGSMVINPAKAVLLTRRLELYPYLAGSGIPFPETHVYTLESDNSLPLPFPFWMKRYDYHHLLPGDVRQVGGMEDLEAARRHFQGAGQTKVFLQEHHNGVRYKFYAVRDPESGEFLFLHFREPEGERRKDELVGLLRRLLDGSGLSVFGGDLLADPDGMLYPVDINAWPSFSGCREEAAKAIVACGMRLLTGAAPA